MEEKRFRNHFSVVLEGVGAGFIAIIVILFSNMISDIGELMNDLSHADISIIPVLIGLGVIILLAALVIGWQIRIWSKTWIVVEENSISIERNTIISKKNTMGIKNISNVNTEQNLFEMIMGTSKVKINTNSLSTSDSTDMKIILKKSEAEKLKTFLLKRMEELNGETLDAEIQQDKQSVDNETEGAKIQKLCEKEEEKEVKTSTKDIILNSIYSMNFGMILMSIGSVCIFIAMLIGIVSAGFEEDSVLETLSGAILIIFVIIIAVAAIVWNLLRTYFKMCGFTVKRNKNKIYMKYGLFKQVDFSIPVDMVNAVVIHQTMIARIFRKYSAEMVNVGMGDEGENDAYFCLYGSKKKLKETIDTILPEFSDAVNLQIEKQPKAVWLHYIKNFLVFLIIFSVIGFMCVSIDVPQNIVIAVVAILMVLVVINHIMTFVTEGMRVSNNYLTVRNGAFGSTYTIMKFDKIQYITIRKNFVTNKLGIARGNVNILAMLAKRNQAMPYFKNDKVELLQKELMRTTYIK